MISTLIAVCNHVHYKAFDHVNISKILKVYLLVIYLFVFIFISVDPSISYLFFSMTFLFCQMPFLQSIKMNCQLPDFSN